MSAVFLADLHATPLAGETDWPAASQLLHARVTLFAVTRLLSSAERATKDEDNVLDILNETARADLIGTDIRSSLLHILEATDVHPLSRLAAGSVLAWRAACTGEPMTPDEALAWAKQAIPALISDPGQPRLRIDDHTLQETLETVHALEVLRSLRTVHDLQRAGKKLLEIGVIDSAALLDSLPLGESDAIALAEEVDVEVLGTALETLGKRGLIADAIRVYEMRRSEFLGSSAGNLATKELLEELIIHGRPHDAFVIGSKYLHDSGSHLDWLQGEEAVMLLNELGNAARILREYELAGTLYSSTLGRLSALDDESRKRLAPVLFRNMAVVMRETGGIIQCRNALLELLTQEMEPQERAKTLATLGTCFLLLGEVESAEQAFDEGLAEIAPRAEIYPDVRLNLLVNSCQTASLLGDKKRAKHWATQAIDLAQQLGDFFVAAIAASNYATAVLSLGEPNASEAVEDAESRIRAAEEVHSNTPWIMQQLESAKADLYYYQGDSARLLQIADSTQDWQIAVAAAHALLLDGEVEKARRVISGAWDYVLEWLAGDDLGASDVNLLRRLRHLQEAEATLASASFLVDKSTGPQLLRAFELSSGIAGGMLAWPANERRKAVDLIAQPIRIVESLPANCLTLLGVQSAWAIHIFAYDSREWMHVGDWDPLTVKRCKAEVAAITKRGVPGGDPLPLSAAWTEFSRRLGELIEPMLAGLDMVVFLPGPPLSGLPLHTIPISEEPLCRKAPFAYSANLIQLLGISGKAPIVESIKPGLVSVPRSHDTPYAIDALQYGRSRFIGAFERLKIPVEEACEIQAALHRIEEVFEWSNIALLSCHGQGQPGVGKHGLLIAHDGQLPPLLGDTTPGSPGSDFLWSWDEIAPPVPDVVLSAACSSGSASFGIGGERVSLDRSFIASGTRFFAGPLWDVDIRDAQTLMVGLLEKHLTGESDWASAWHQVILEVSGNMAPASWQAFVLTGDWNCRIGIRE
jgi:tetratricopeptide (TPR) repeat protein